MKKQIFKNSLIIVLSASIFVACNPSENKSDNTGTEARADSTQGGSSITGDANQTDKSAYEFIKGQTKFSYFNRLVELSPEVQKILSLKKPIYVLIPSDEFINMSEESYKSRFIGKDEEDIATAMLKPYIFVVGDSKENGIELMNFSHTKTVIFEKKNRTIDNLPVKSDVIKASNGAILESPIIIE